MPLYKQPTLTGTYVGVRPLLNSDYGALYAVVRDPPIWEHHAVPNRYEEATFRAFFDEAVASGGTPLVTELATGGVIGSSRFHGYSESNSEVEIGWTFLARRHWGGEYNGDLKSIMVRYAFHCVDTILLLIDTSNFRSRRAAEKTGAVAGPELDETGRIVYRLVRSGGMEVL